MLEILNYMEEDRMNIVCVVFDSLRKDCLGAYGHPFWGKVATPHLDNFASESMVFTKAYPESLPTLPARRALYTGKRVYPFHNGEFHLKGDFIGAPGWGPIPETDDTISEILSAKGYTTGLISSVFHQFKPSKNYWRGFDQWTFVRGKENDPYRSGPEPTREEIDYYFCEELAEHYPDKAGFIKEAIKNLRTIRHEEDYPVAKVMTESARWLEENRDAKNFFLMVESFDPHELWNVPAHYRELYDSSTKKEQILSGYADTSNFPADLLKRTQANYSGLVTMCDRWFGHLYESLRTLGLLENTAVIVTSDHGHSIGDKNYMGKRGYPSSPEVYDIPLMVRHPGGEGAGRKSDILLQNHDIFSLMLELSGAGYDLSGLDGMNFWNAAMAGDGSSREHATIAWGAAVTVVEKNLWMNCRVNGKGAFLYDTGADPSMVKNIAGENHDIAERLFNLALKDACGGFPAYLLRQAEETEDFPGCSAIASKKR